MVVAQALLFKDGLIIVEAADEQIEFDKFSFHKTILSTHCSSAFLLLIRIDYYEARKIVRSIPLCRDMKEV